MLKCRCGPSGQVLLTNIQTMSLSAVIGLSALPALVQGHGIFWSPTSRAQLAQLSGWESDATKIIAEPMPEVAHGREYPGGRPWAEPGKSVSNVGPCGMKSYGQKTNWNHPEHEDFTH